jgi:glutamyl/glutaminyl-tRNA synthetase
LGWNPGKGETQEMFSMEELIEKFDLTKVHRAGAVFDLKKLDWLNSQYIKKMPIEELYAESLVFFKQKSFFENASPDKKSEDYIKKVLTIEQERLVSLSGVGESNKFFFQDIHYNKHLLAWKNMSGEEVKNNLQKAKNILEDISESNWTKIDLEKILLEAAGDKRGEFLWPLRVALTGEQKSPPPFEVAWVLGKAESIKRIEFAIEHIST